MNLQPQTSRWRHSVLLPAAVALAGLCAAVAGALWLQGRAQADTEAAFQRGLARAAAEVSTQFRLPLYGLNGARGIYATNDTVSRGTFRTYVQTRNMALEFPGVRGFGFIERVPRSGLQAFLERERSDDAPDFALRLLGEHTQPEHFVIKFIEPAQRNAGAAGLDLASEAVRRQGLAQALETGEATVSGVITLVQDQRRSPGMLLFVPLYQSGDPASEPSARLLRGVLYAPIVIAELLAGLSDVQSGQLQVALFDTASGHASGPRMFDSAALGSSAAEGSPPPRFEATTIVTLPGRLVTLRARSSAAFDAQAQSFAPWLFFGGTLCASLLLAGLLRQQATGRQRAERIAQGMTADLGRLALVARRSSNGVVITDLQRRITWVNEGFERITGYSAAEALGQSPGALLQDKATDPATVQQLRQALNARQRFSGEVLNRSKLGRLYWLSLDIQPLHDDSGTLVGFMALQLDITARKQAETALLASQSFLSQTGRIGGVGGWELDLETQRFDWTDETCQLYEVGVGHRPSLAEALDFFPPAAQQQVIDAVQKGVLTGQPFDIEVPVVTAKGRHLWVRTVGEPKHVDGHTVRLVGAFQDITARRLAEAEARRSAELLRGAVEALDDAFVLYGPDDRLVMCNQRHRDIYPKSAVMMQVGRSFEEIVRYAAEQGQYADRSRSVDDWVAERVAQHRQPFSRLTQQLADGRTLRIVERRMADGHTVGFRVDITELVRATADAKQSSQEASRALARLQAIYDILPVGLTVTDPQGHIIDCNPASERLLGVSREEHLRRDYSSRDWTILREDGTAMQTEEIPGVRALADGVAVHDALMQVVTPARTVWLSVSAMPVQHDALGVVIAYADVTEQRAQHQALLAAKAQAEQASVAKSQFLANMSHEIRTPMNAILGMLALLKKTDLSARQADYAGKTEGAARSLLGLLNDILDFSKVEAGKMLLDPHPFRIDQLMRDLSVIVSANVGAKPVEVLFDIDPALPRGLVGDALRLQQVLINLSGNAVKFTQSGEVVVSVKVLAQRSGEVSLRVAVRDTGIGIAPENQARIFSGFTQAEASTTRRFGGTGLGVAISQRLVVLMGGELKVDSALGRGSTFHFDLVLPVAAHDGSAAADSAPGRHAPALRALVVDDNPTAREVLQRMSQSLGWTVDTADSGEAALARLQDLKARGERYDAVFVDWQMPGLDGWATTRRIRDSGLAGDAPVVVMVTAHGREMLEQRSSDDQALLDGFLVKPVTASMLLDAVVDARLGHHHPHPSARVGNAVGRRLAGMRLLVAEDNLNNQQVARELLEDEGAEVQMAANGQIAVEAVAAADPPFDAVLMDLQMPVMDGFTATARIRQDLQNTSLPIVAITANAMASDREACLAAGMNDHVGKPFDLDHLVQVLRRVAGRDTGVATLAAASAEVDAEVSAEISAVIHAAASAAGVQLAPALRRLGGKVPVYERMLGCFVHDLADMQAALERCLQAQDSAAAGRMLHTLKGLAATLGIQALADAAAKAEQTLTQAPAAAGLQGILTAMAQARPPLADLLAALQSARVASAPSTTPTLALPAPSGASLTELINLLENSDMRATEVMAALQQQCRSSPALLALEAAVCGLDFERALAVGRGLLAETAP